VDDRTTPTGQALVAAEQFESILRNVGDAITVQAPDGGLLYANDAAVRHLGYASREELLSAPRSALVERYELLDEAGGTLPVESLPSRIALRGLETEQLVRYRLRETGEEHWSRVRSTPVRDDAGELAFVITSFRDVTEQHRAQERAEERLHAARVLEYIAEGVFMLDADGAIRFWNPAAEEITGLRAANVVGWPAPMTIPGWERIVAAVAREPPGRHVTVPLDLGGREVWLSIGAVGFDEGMVFAFRDLTEERAIEQLKADFVSTVSHELRTPLAAIYGASRTLQRGDIELTAERRSSLLGVISNESDRLARTVNAILWASRLDSGTLRVDVETCDPGELVAEVVDSMRTHLPERITLAVWDVEALPSISCDPDNVRQVLSNLIDNAIKYSPEGGVVEVRLSRNGNAVRFAVRDEGLGIAEPEQRRIFEKFYRADPNLSRGIGGTGLGLYICQELVRRMDGRIWVESREGEGSTFSFELPTAPI
jgi:two-component system, OmpR family, sensor histidine kinase VicK